jgi:hypothetical protein
MRIGDDEIKRIIDRKNINIAFNSKSLNWEQKSQINHYNKRNIYLLDNYYYSKLETKYEIELINKINSINLINQSNEIIDDYNRIDIKIFKILLSLFLEVKTDLRNIIKKNYSINIIINEIEQKIEKEKIVIEKLLSFFHKNNEELQSRLEDLNKINRTILKNLLNNDHYFIYIRECLIKLLNSSLVLINTCIIIIINYGLIRFEDIHNKIKFIHFLDLEIKNALNLYENVKESVIDNNDYKRNLKNQKYYYYSIINSINKNNNNIRIYLLNIISKNNNEMINKEDYYNYLKSINNDMKISEKLLKSKKNKKHKRNSNYMNIFKIMNFRKKKIKELSNSDKLLIDRNKIGINDV